MRRKRATFKSRNEKVEWLIMEREKLDVMLIVQWKEEVTFDLDDITT